MRACALVLLAAGAGWAGEAGDWHDRLAASLADWRSDDQIPPGCLAAWTGPDGSRLTVAEQALRLRESDPLPTWPEWLETQVACWSGLSPGWQWEEPQGDNAASWRHLHYRFEHAGAVWRQHAWLRREGDGASVVVLGSRLDSWPGHEAEAARIAAALADPERAGDGG